MLLKLFWKSSIFHVNFYQSEAKNCFDKVDVFLPRVDVVSSLDACGPILFDVASLDRSVYVYSVNLLSF